ncbi:MAG: hypothetical protein Q9162_004897 [Coniocarpon cinnabarinum]
MKRPADEPDHLMGSSVKRLRVSAPAKARHRQLGDLLLPANPQDPAVIEALLQRTIAIVLQDAGFDAVNKDAFESLCNMLDEYLTRATRLSHMSMKSGRRNKIDPHDIDFALRHDGIRLDSLAADASLTSEAKPSIVRCVAQPPLFPARATTSTAHHFTFPGSLELSKQLGGMADQARRRWIPRHLPAFPPPHTYKSTPIPLSTREVDARKVRERATEEGVLAERALRKLVGARKKVGSRTDSRAGSQAGSRPGTRAGLSHTNLNGKRSRNVDAFEEAMDATLQEDRAKGRESLQQEDEMLFLGSPVEKSLDMPGAASEDRGDEMAFGAVVNWDRDNWRSAGREVTSWS